MNLNVVDGILFRICPILQKNNSLYKIMNCNLFCLVCGTPKGIKLNTGHIAQDHKKLIWASSPTGYLNLIVSFANSVAGLLKLLF
jgi:hypothetical protein